MDADIDDDSSGTLLMYGVQMTFCISALFINTLLLYLLTRYTGVFHHHMRIIMINLTLSVNAVNFYLLIRAIIGVFQNWPFGDSDDEPNPLGRLPDARLCSFSDSVPPIFCVHFLLFPLFLSIERCYATQSYRRYENENVQPVYGVMCGVLWLPAALHALASVADFNAPRSLGDCQYVLLINKTPLQRNIWMVMVATFCLLFAAFFKCLQWQNKAHEMDYVKNNYTTISIRFQIRENLRTCRFAVGLNSLFAGSFAFSFWLDQNNLENSQTRREYLFLIFPMFAILYAIHFITSHPTIFEKAKRVWREMSPVPTSREQQKMLQS